MSFSPPTSAPTVTATSGGSTDSEVPSVPAQPKGASRSSSAGTAGQTITRTLSPGARRTRSQAATKRLQFQKDVAVLRAEGMTQMSVAKTLNTTPVTVAAIEKLPAVREQIQQLRETWKRVAQEEITAASQQAWQMASTFVEQRDSKAFDNTVRGLVGLEKISASVSGEHQKVELVNPPSPHVELKVLLQQLIGLPSAGTP